LKTLSVYFVPVSGVENGVNTGPGLRRM